MRGIGKRKVVAVDPAAVVRHADPLFSAFFYLNGNFCSAGVDRIFDELLDDRIGTVDDLSRRDLIIDAGRKNIDLHLYFSFHSDMSASACIGVSRLTSISRSSSARPESGSGADGSSSSGI